VLLTCTDWLLFLHRSDALAPEYAASVRTWYEWMIIRNPHYRMSVDIAPDAPVEEGVDCSRYHYLVYTRAKVVPRPQRVTSREIALGRGGWTGITIPLNEAKDLDIVFWTWRDRPDRPDGHTGAFLEQPDGELKVTHASSKRGVVLDSMRGSLIRDVSRVRRITIGD
jgi:hypothetical protein